MEIFTQRNKKKKEETEIKRLNSIIEQNKILFVGWSFSRQI